MASMMRYTASPKYAIESGILTFGKKYFLKRMYFCTFLFLRGVRGSMFRVIETAIIRVNLERLDAIEGLWYGVSSVTIACWNSDGKWV